MAITNQNFTIYQRSDYALEYTVTDEDGAAVDCTGAGFELAIIASNGADAIRLSNSGRFAVSGDNGNIVTIKIYEEETDIAVGFYCHELRVRDVFGNTAPVSTGGVTVRSSKTNL